MNENRGLWRGLSTQWHYGDLVRANSEDNCSPMIVENGVHYAVYPSTLGACIGFCDINKKPIFEGDIVKDAVACLVGIVKWSSELGVAGFVVDDFNDGEQYIDFWDKMEIIGNIFDKTELLLENKT